MAGIGWSVPPVQLYTTEALACAATSTSIANTAVKMVFLLMFPPKHSYTGTGVVLQLTFQSRKKLGDNNSRELLCLPRCFRECDEVFHQQVQSLAYIRQRLCGGAVAGCSRAGGWNRTSAARSGGQN